MKGLCLNHILLIGFKHLNYHVVLPVGTIIVIRCLFTPQ